MKNNERYTHLLKYRHDRRYADDYTISKANFDFLLTHYEMYQKLRKDYDLLKKEVAKREQNPVTQKATT